MVLTRHSAAMSTDHALTIRRAGHDDAHTLAALAALDSARELQGEALLAEADGVPVAAVELASGRAVADPFQHTAAIVELLRLRAARMSAPAPRRLRGSVLRPA